MSADLHRPAHWHTASFGASADTSPMELSMLGEHLGRCRGRSARWSALRCGVESLHRFIASRLMTTLVIATLLLAAVSLAS